MSKLTKDRVTLNGRTYQLICDYCGTESYWKSNGRARECQGYRHYGHRARVNFLTVSDVENLLKVN